MIYSLINETVAKGRTAKGGLRIVAALCALMFCAAMTGCTSTAELVYLKNAVRDSAIAVQSAKISTIEPGDIISIFVESETPESALQFNQETNKLVVSGQSVINPNENRVPGYLVSPDGDIIFPVLGKLHVAGMTHTELAALLERRLIKEGHITDPVVTVRLMNFRVTVLGEVGAPRVLHSEAGRMTIFEAIGEAGDISLQGKRSNVTVVREENGQRTIGTINLTSDSLFLSPYYMLHQNDIVYVEPTDKRKKDAARNTQFMQYLSMTISVVSLATTVVYYTLMIRRLGGGSYW